MSHNHSNGHKLISFNTSCCHKTSIQKEPRKTLISAVESVIWINNVIFVRMSTHGGRKFEVCVDTLLQLAQMELVVWIPTCRQKCILSFTFIGCCKVATRHLEVKKKTVNGFYNSCFLKICFYCCVAGYGPRALLHTVLNQLNFMPRKVFLKKGLCHYTKANINNDSWAQFYMQCVTG